MPTFVASFVNSVQSRFAEVDRLLCAAGETELSDVRLHDAICRSVVVLLAAHLEGFVRDAAKALVDDLNRFSEFGSLPEHPKRTFCKVFIPEEGKDANDRTKKLIRLLNGLDTKLDWESFLATTENEGHKNATPSIIERVFRNFGVKKVFNLLSSSSLDEVFSATSSEVENLEQLLEDHVKSHTADFPYTVEPEQFGLHTAVPTVGGVRTLWESFVDDLMHRRHRIAHGAVVDNNDSVQELRLSRRKIAVLQYGLLIVLCHSLMQGGHKDAD